VTVAGNAKGTTTKGDAMTQPEIVQTRRLPTLLKTLLRQRGDWITTRSMQRLPGREFVESRLTSFVRHNHTNYERLLETLPDVKGKTEEEMMDSYLERDRLHRQLRDAAHVVAVDALTAAYGTEWEAEER